MLTDLPFDLLILMLRVAFIFLLYFFLFQVIRVVSRELQTTAVATPRAAAPAGPALTLIDAGESELVAGATFSLKPTTTIGRSSDNVIILPDAFVSSHHARLVNTNGRWYFTDLGSTNGSFVNNQRSTPSAQLVKDGDILQIGRVKLRLAAY